MFGAVTHGHDTPATVDKLVQGFSECRAKLRLLEESQEQLESKAALAHTTDVGASLTWQDHGGKRIGGGISEKAMQDQVRYDTLQPRSYDEPPPLPDTVSPPRHQGALYDEELPFQMLRQLGPDMACMLDSALERQRVMIDAAHHALDGLGGANRALISDLAESRANEVTLSVALDDLHAVHQATEASQEEKLNGLYAAHSAAQHELATLRRLAAADKDELARLRDEIEAMRAELSRLHAEGAVMHADNTSMEKTIVAQCRAEATLRDEISGLITAKEKAESDLSVSQGQNSSLKACLGGKDALIVALRREVDDEKKARLSAHSLLVAISGFPAQGQHWEDLSASLKLSRQSPCESPASWQWLQAWDDAAQPPNIPGSTTAALCFACVCLHNWMDDHGRARDCLQSLVNSLQSAAELPVGLCHTVLFAVLEAAHRRPLRFDVALLLCQAAQLLAAKCPSDRRKEAAAKVRACVARDCADAALLDALLEGWGSDRVGRVPFCAPTLAQEGHIIYVQSIDSLLFVSRERLRLRWISVRCIDWTKSSVDTVHLRSGDVSQKVKFGQVGAELFKALLHL